MFLSFEQIFYYFLGFLPFFLVVFFWTTLRKNFFDWKEDLFYLKQERVLLEIRIPQEITKTPLAMELIFQSLYNPSGEGNWWKKKYKGKRRPRFSLEIASDGGKIRFYIFTEVKYKQSIENIFYSQYQTIEITEVPDYTKFVAYDPDDDYLMGCEFGKSKEDPYPIKTYDKFGLDKVGLKPEEIQDPVSSILEAMGSIEQKDKMWLQIVFKAQKKDKEVKLSIFKRLKNRIIDGSWSKAYDWRKEAEAIVEKLKTSEDKKDADGKIQLGKLTSSQNKMIDDIIENIDRPAFWVTIRYVYKSPDKEAFKKHAFSMFSFFPATGSVNGNMIRPTFETSFKNPWDDFDGNRLRRMKIDIFKDYKRRKMATDYKKYFTWGAYELVKYKQMRLSTKELATIFHLPFSTVSPATLERTKFKKAEAPVDLPT